MDVGFVFVFGNEFVFYYIVFKVLKWIGCKDVKEIFVCKSVLILVF